MLKPLLQLKLSQQLKMTPQLQQALRLLQLPILALEAYILEALDENVMLEKVEDLLISPSEREKVSGLVTWFSLPSKNPVTPPPRYKMTIVSWLALYPAVTAIFWLFGPWLAELPLLIRTMIVTGVVMVLMSYVLMPFMTKRFAFWLYPHKKR